MKLIIAEKPSLARSVAKVIGGYKENKSKGCIECNDGFVVTWLFGHIIELVKPEVYDPKNKFFRMDNLPIIPTNWIYQPKSNSQDQYVNIKSLLKSATVVINCGDPDREGQLLVDELLIHLNNNKPVKRLLILDPKDSAIRRSLDNMNDNAEYHTWYLAGLLRTQADWLIGFNFTPAFTILGQKLGIEGIISMGRVQTPTLKLIYDRELAITSYKALSYYNLIATFCTIGAQKFTAKLDLNGLNVDLDCEGRLLDKKQLGIIQSAIKSQKGVITKYEVKDCETAQPLPFKLSDLQSLVNAKLGFSADEVLKIAQSLYEKQLITYPRTACAYLPESLHADGANILNSLSSVYPDSIKSANPQIKSRAFNDKQLGGESHFAIVPSGDTKSLLSLKAEELAVFKIIALQYIAQFYPPMKYQQTTGIVSCLNYKFNFSGKITKLLGWKELFKLSNKEDEVDSKEDEDQVLPPLGLNEPVKHVDDEIKKSTTTKPKPYTEGTLIKAMANIHTSLDEIVKSYYHNPSEAKQIIEKYKKVLKDTAGLGTEATRAGAINKLKEREYIQVTKKNIVITPKGIATMDLLTKGQNLANFSLLTSPLTTAMYEQQLDSVLNKTLTAEQFIANVHNMLKDKISVIKEINNNTASTKPNDKLTGNKCPNCGKDNLLRLGKFGEFECCSGYPECKYIAKAPATKTIPTGEKCPQCKAGDMIIKSSKFGEMKACNQYPKCNYIEQKPKVESKPLEVTGKKCPKCGADMVKRKSKFGDFEGCLNYPKCK